MVEEKITSKFIDFDDESLNIKRQNGIIFTDPTQTSLLRNYESVTKYLLKGVPIYMKDMYYENGEESAAIFEVVISKIMNECAVNSIPYFPIFEVRRNGKMMLCSFSQDMASIDNISFVPGNCQFWLDGKMRKAKGGGKFRDDVWYFLENPAVKKHLLKHMTDECFEQLVDSCLIDELMGQIDRHLTNYFFFKGTDSKKYEGIMNFDNALTWIFESNGYKEKNKIGFESNMAYFVYHPFSKKSNAGVISKGSYADRIKKICELFDKGLLGERQAKLVKTYIESDISTKLKDQADKCQRPISPAVLDLYSRVNEYLEQNLQREL